MATAQVRNDVAFNRIPINIRARWKLVRDVVAGEEELRTGAYLPTLNKLDVSAANIARNDAYRIRACWYPATGYTLDGFMGLAFRNDPTSMLEGKKGLEELITNADGAGVSLYQQSQGTLSSVTSIGRHCLFVDWLEAKKRPVIKSYHAESFINWKFKIVGGEPVLSMVVLEENVEEDDGEWAVKNVTQYREIFLDESGICNVRLWRESDQKVNGQNAFIIRPILDAKGNAVPAVQLRSRGKPLNFIPFVAIGAKNNDGTIGPSPMYGLAALNVAHFRNSADYEDSVFFVGQVQPWISGLDEAWRDQLQNPKDELGNSLGPTMYVGSRTPILLPKDGQFGFAQAQPNTLVRDAMDQKEQQMVAVGARIIESTPGTRTATEDENDREATTSVLSMCVSNVNEGYQRAIWMCAQYLDMGESFDAADSYKITQDFVRAAANPAIMTELVKQWQSGVISKDDVRDYDRKVGLIATERTNEEIQSDIDIEGPALGTIGMGQQTGMPPIVGSSRPPPNKKPSTGV